jgi:pilus assembly protein CpaF
MANLQTFERTEYQQVKADLHRKILDRLDLEKLGRTPSDTARDEVLLLIRNTVNSEAVPLSFAERERLSREILDEIFGLGPLEPLLKDPTVSDILVNRYDRVYVERAGKLEPTGLSFKDDAHLMQIIDRIVSRVERRNLAQHFVAKQCQLFAGRACRGFLHGCQTFAQKSSLSAALVH